jgi:formamidopyrimidine-DNA glycosylase
MPELPEVERGRQLLERVAVGRSIAKVKCERDAIVYDGVAPRTFQHALKGRRVEAACRRGKQLWLMLDRGPHPLFHFGMTGAFHSRDERPVVLESSRKAPESDWPPRFAKIHIVLDDGGALVMTNARRLGRILLRDDPAHEPPISRLGFDPLLDLPGPKAFVEAVSRRKTILKALLMDQTFAAGVGNWIADEVLYQARLDPRRRADSLTAEEAKRMRTCMKRIIEKAVSVNAEKKRFPKSWLFHHRWGKNSEAVTARGEAIEHLTLGGRTTAWVPGVQR